MKIPKTMRAAVLTGHGGLDKIEIRDDWPTPQPAAMEALIGVGACGVNNTDINTRLAWYAKDENLSTSPPLAGRTEVQGGGSNDGKSRGGHKSGGAWGGKPVDFPRIQGADVAGIVVAVGADADSGLVGKRVLIDPWLRDWSRPDIGVGYFGSERDGGFAEYAAADVRNIHPIGGDLSDAELATFPTPCVTAENMLCRAALAAGELILITGASGGVGTALIQLAKRRGATVAAMASPAKFAALRAIGADAVIARDEADLPAALRKTTGRERVDVAADVVGGKIWPGLIRAVRRGGRYVCAGAIAGAKVDFDLRDFYLRDLTLVGATVPSPQVFPAVVGYIAAGEIRPLLARAYPLAEIHAAQEAFLAKQHAGNLVVIP